MTFWRGQDMAVRILMMALVLCLGAVTAQAQADRLVALVVSGDAGTERANAVQGELQALGAETLRAISPNNAQLRSILKRFAREAADARATFVYLDVPVVRFDNRAYVLPTDASVALGTDLFTQGIPIQAFARSSAQAEQGGAVVTTRAARPEGIPTELTDIDVAPEAVPGSSPILLMTPAGFDTGLTALAAAATSEEVELGALLQAMMADDASISALPSRPAYLKQPAQPATTAPAATPVLPGAADTDEAESLEELTFLEKSLSRSAKRAVQRQLRSLGHYRGLVDGIFGPQTRTAISAYQSERSEAATGVLSRRQLLDLSS
ncbi:MAG: peptidoglycan-binding domain-containing protein [Pseudomonadota bacterium]